MFATVFKSCKRTSISLIRYSSLTDTRSLLRDVMRRVPPNKYSCGNDHWQSFQHIETPLMGEEVSAVSSCMFDQPIDAPQLYGQMS
jgi:hypothetical protein